MHSAIKIAAAAFASLLAIAPAFAVAADPTGTWAATDGKSRYEISFCGGGEALCGKLIWLRDADDPNRDYLNKMVVKGQQAAENKWTGTVIHNGDTYSGTMVMKEDGSLKVTGCQAIFCQTVNLTKV